MSQDDPNVNSDQSEDGEDADLRSKEVHALEDIGASVDVDAEGHVRCVVLVGQLVTDDDLKTLRPVEKTIRRLNLIYTKLTGPGLANLRGMNMLERLDLGANIHLQDEGLMYLQTLPSLDMLRVWDTKITDRGLYVVESLPKLRWLYLSGTAINGAGLVYLKKLPRLRGLDLRATQITDASMKQLEMLQNLEWIDLSDTQINGKGLIYLSQLPRLKRIHIRHTQIVPRHLKKFRKYQPDCQINQSEAEAAPGAS